ncbi:MAG: RNA pseudouridine synthase [Bacteroidales bacterium]|nr:RNA pseudouridine synthase [Bacteroidales bacterium]
MHIFPTETTASLPERFTDPFRYAPHPLVKEAAGIVIREIESRSDLHEAFMEGKMLGVMITSDSDGHLGYLAGFSGNVGGRSHIEGFVPPIYDLLDPSGHFKIREAEITAMNSLISEMQDSSKHKALTDRLSCYEKSRDEEISIMKARMALSKKQREEARRSISDPTRLSELIRESQFEKAQLKRLKASWEEKICEARREITEIQDEIKNLKSRRAAMSDKLQKWIFSQYIVHNQNGEEKSIGEIFADLGLTPPGGTGECAAPKLLEHAYRNGLKPLAMGEFWYGESPSTAVRTHGHFYPSCTSKCGPLLSFMMKGLEVEKDTQATAEPIIIYEDAFLLAVDKPSGMPSVPGLDGRVSAYEFLCRTYTDLHVIHRLDMDTSGLLLFAKTAEAAAHMQRQFEEHTIHKTYHAKLSASESGKELKAGDNGEISLPLSPDYDERPRQKVDHAQGKAALTRYEVISVSEDGTTDVAFHPHTGRTHQLRVHAAHTLGLGRPIVGDMLYGGSPASRLHLHASSITFRHPSAPSQLFTIVCQSGV